MRLSKIKIRNYRLLIDAELEVDSKTTLIVGRNNTAKTSCFECIGRGPRLPDFLAVGPELPHLVEPCPVGGRVHPHRRPLPQRAAHPGQAHRALFAVPGPAGGQPGLGRAPALYRRGPLVARGPGLPVILYLRHAGGEKPALPLARQMAEAHHGPVLGRPLPHQHGHVAVLNRKNPYPLTSFANRGFWEAANQG